MHKYLLAVIMLGMSGFAAFAEPPASTGAVSSSAAPTSVPAAKPKITEPAPPQPIIAMLNDGSKVELDADGSVWVLDPDGKKSVAPDGTLTLKDGTPFVVKEGKRSPGDE